MSFVKQKVATVIKTVEMDINKYKLIFLNHNPQFLK